MVPMQWPTHTLASLINTISEIGGVERITYSTSHPINMTDDLIQLHGSNDKLMPYLHLPVQSGSDNVLKLMNRKHTRDYYFEIIEKVRKAKPILLFLLILSLVFLEKPIKTLRIL